MKFPAGFNYSNCIPTEEDFEAIYKAKCIGDTYNTFNHKIDDEYYYHTIRRLIAAILLDWKAAGKYLEDRLITYSPQPYDKAAIKSICKFIGTNSQAVKAAFDKYRQKAVDIGQPEEIAQKARDDRKGEIQVNVKNPNGGFFRIIEYSMKYGDNNPTKKQSGARMHLYISKKQGNVYGISIRGSNTFGSKRTELDEPFFATEQEARDFIANIDHQHINTAVSLEDWRFVISDKPVDYA